MPAPGVLLTQRKFAGYVLGYSGTSVFIDELLQGAAGAAANLPKSAQGESAAYVIYTSGSTGIPKGVVALHRGALNRFAWMWKIYPFGTDEKSCQKTSLNFVDSVWEIFGALLQGVPTVLIPDAIVKEPRLARRPSRRAPSHAPGGGPVVIARNSRALRRFTAAVGAPQILLQQRRSSFQGPRRTIPQSSTRHAD